MENSKLKVKNLDGDEIEIDVIDIIENQDDNKRYFYQLEGEGIRYELVAFRNNVIKKRKYSYIEPTVSRAFISVIQDFYERKDTYIIV